MEIFSSFPPLFIREGKHHGELARSQASRQAGKQATKQAVRQAGRQERK